MHSVRDIKSVKIGPVMVPVRLAVMPDSQGMADWTGICLNTEDHSSDQDMVSSLFHECIETISIRYNLKLKERQVRVLENAILCLLQDNPEFTTMLIQKPT